MTVKSGAGDAVAQTAARSPPTSPELLEIWGISPPLHHFYGTGTPRRTVPPPPPLLAEKTQR